MEEGEGDEAREKQTEEDVEIVERREEWKDVRDEVMVMEGGRVEEGKDDEAVEEYEEEEEEVEGLEDEREIRWRKGMVLRLGKFRSMRRQEKGIKGNDNEERENRKEEIDWNWRLMKGRRRVKK